MKNRPAVIVLAAGSGSRFRGPRHKLEQDLEGASVLATTLRHAADSQLPVVAVVTRALEPLARPLAADVVVMPDVASQPGLGMGASIAAGVNARSDASGWLILPGDMPMVQPATLLAVVRALEQHPVAYAQYNGRRGHPVGFGAELYSDLVELKGDEGARRLLARYPTEAVDVDDPGVLIDIDTQEDIAALRASLAAHQVGAG